MPGGAWGAQRHTRLGHKVQRQELSRCYLAVQVGHGKVGCPTHGRSGYTSQGPEADPEEGSWAGAFCQGPTQPQRAVWRDWGTVGERLCREGLEMVPPRRKPDPCRCSTCSEAAGKGQRHRHGSPEPASPLSAAACDNLGGPYCAAEL